MTKFVNNIQLKQTDKLKIHVFVIKDEQFINLLLKLHIHVYNNFNFIQRA